MLGLIRGVTLIMRRESHTQVNFFCVLAELICFRELLQIHTIVLKRISQNVAALGEGTEGERLHTKK